MCIRDSYITGDKYGSVTESPVLSMSRGTTYTFNQNDSSNNLHAIYFSTNEDAYGGTLRYEVGVTYTINDEVVSWTEYNSTFTTLDQNGSPTANQPTRSVSITPAINSPDTLYYVCQNHLAMGNAIQVKSDVTNSRNMNIINDPILGTHTLSSVDAANNQINYYSSTQPETGYAVGLSYTTNSIYPVSYTHLTLPTNREV